MHFSFIFRRQSSKSVATYTARLLSKKRKKKISGPPNEIVKRNYFFIEETIFDTPLVFVWAQKWFDWWKLYLSERGGSVWNSKFELSLHPCCPFSIFSLGVHRVLHTIVTVRLKRNVSSVQKFAMITSRGQKGLDSRAMWLAIDASSEKQINCEQIPFSCKNRFNFLKNCLRNSSSLLMLTFFARVWELLSKLALSRIHVCNAGEYFGLKWAKDLEHGILFESLSFKVNLLLLFQ